MRAAYQLNQEKLDYNYRVLLERDAENQATITQQKRKVSKQRDLLTTLMVGHQHGLLTVGLLTTHALQIFTAVVWPVLV